MLTAERRKLILESLRREGRVLASELSSRFEVSEDTIRRDLRDLAEEGLLSRVHGGALPQSPVNPSYAQRQKESPSAKAAIAATASKLFKNGQIILFDGGTTPLQVAQRLPPDLKATVITHSLPVVMALADHPHVTVIVAGGTLSKEAMVATGPETIEAYRSVRADVYVLGAARLPLCAGLTRLDPPH